MLDVMDVQPKRLDAYRGMAPDEQIEEILSLAGRLKGARVLEVNATGFGGGVAELLTTLVPLMRDVGLEAEWRVMGGAPEFFERTKRLHNVLQGASEPFDEEAREIYLRYSRENARAFDEEYDFVVVHDPQPAALRTLMLEEGRGGFGRWIWRCHIDLTDARQDAWNFVRPYVEAHDAAVFTSVGYVKPDLELGEVAIIWPAIDPTSPKNARVDPEEAATVIEGHGVDPERPLLVQVSRYDPWKDPEGAVGIYQRVKREVPGLQMALVATMAEDDPEGEEYLDRTTRRAGEDPDVHLLASYVDNTEDVRAFQSAADVVLQNSKREGFGLVVTEALWKGTPVVAHDVGGIPLQLRDGLGDCLVKSDEEATEKIVHLFKDSDLRSEMGARGRERVREDFLITRHLLDHLRLFEKLAQREP